MKRWIQLACLFLCFMILLSGCGKQAEPVNDKTSSTALPADSESSDSESPEDILSRAPEEYDLAFTISINPRFIIYVLNDEVFAYEALNEEAVLIEPRCVLTGRLFKDALKDIVRFSYEEGYLIDGGDVAVTIIRAYTNEEEADKLLKEAETAIQEIANDCSITINPVITIESTVVFIPPEQSSVPAEEDPSQGEGITQGSDTSSQSSSGELSQNSSESGNQGEESQYSESSTGNGSYEEESRPEERDPYEGCPVCGGTGYCDRCHGLGTVYCDECGGTGYVTCSKCWGAGYAGYDDYGPKPCDQCNGYGIVMHENCAGTGAKNCPGCHGIGTCSVCHGSGYNPDD